MSWEVVSCWIESHPGLASWVQAVGSIFAIIVAVAISGSDRRYQAKIARSARRDAIDRSIQASLHAMKIAKNTFDFFSSNSIPRSIIPRYLAVIDQASKYVDEVYNGSSVDSQIAGALSEVRNALLDSRSLASAWADNLDNDYSYEIQYFKANIQRIAFAIENLEKMRVENRKWSWVFWRKEN